MVAVRRFVFLIAVFYCPPFIFSQSSFLYQSTTKDLALIPVIINGGGVNPGTYYVPPALRVYDIIKMASYNGNPDLFTIDCRCIKFTVDGVTSELDMLKYLSRGDFSDNPFIRAGSIIQLHYAINYVQLEGELQGRVLGKVPLRRAETAGELLSLYTFTSCADTSNIILFRDGKEFGIYSYSKIAGVILKDRDLISVVSKKNVSLNAMVKVSGEAASPGVYPIIKGVTTITQILNQAGGASADGDIGRAYLIRRAKLQRSISDSFLAGQNNIRPEVTGGFKYLSVSRDYAIISATKGETLLEDGDEIIIPTLEHCVYVSGCVKKPGAYPYVEGKGVSFYIDVADGYTRSADKSNVKVITPFTDHAFSISVPRRLSRGDIVMVPEEQEDKWIKRWSPVISAVATVVSSVSVVVGLVEIAKR